MTQYIGAWVCAMCGRQTTKPAVLIGEDAIGPVCARRAGLIQVAKSSGKGGRIRLFSASRAPRGMATPTTGDPFEGIEDDA